MPRYIAERGDPVETLRRGGSPEGVILSPDTATLAECGVTRSMGVWEYLWEDSTENQTSFMEEKEKMRGMVTSFMQEFPDVGRKGKAVTGDDEDNDDEPEDWDEGMKKKRAEMEAAVAAERQKKNKKKTAALEQMAKNDDGAVVDDNDDNDKEKEEKKEEEVAAVAAAAAPKIATATVTA